MPEPTIWQLGDQTPGKHLVLRAYLDAWLPILGMRQSRILLIDGFAGPGEYAGGEPGSPIIALRALKEHAAKGNITAEVIFLFVESDAARAANLSRLVDQERPLLPQNATVLVITGKFDETVTARLDDVESGGKRLAPTFLMADPFGVSDTPHHLIARFLRHEKSEVYISFMYEAINRWKTTPEFEPHLDMLFGCREWRDGINIVDPERKKAFFFELYREQLRAAGAVHVVHFELYQGNRLVYAIFFGSHHSLGCDKMKQAIWKVAPFGDYAFRGARGEQLGLEIGEPDLQRFGRELRAAFATDGWLRIEELEAFSQSDKTDFHSGHLKATLRQLEVAGALIGDDASRNRSKTYPVGARVRFT